MTYLPAARTDELVIQNLEKEVLIYDLKINKAFHLNETLKIVYEACDGKTSFDGLIAEHNFTNELIYLALGELDRENLLKKDQPRQSPLAGLSRRETIKKIGLASMIALPVISSIVAPTAAQGASALLPLFAACTTNSQCASDFCTQGPPRCCVPGTAGIRGANVCCDGTPANCNPQCCSKTGTISPFPTGGAGCQFIIACPNG